MTFDLSTLTGALRWLSVRGFISGSISRGDNHAGSDIDVRLADRHVKALKRELIRQGVAWDSPFMGCITWYPEGVQVETAFIFPRYRRGRTVVVSGVPFRT